MGGHFVRLLVSVNFIVKSDCFEWVPNPHPHRLHEGEAFADELSAYLIDNIPHHDRTMSVDYDGTLKGALQAKTFNSSTAMKSNSKSS